MCCQLVSDDAAWQGGAAQASAKVFREIAGADNEVSSQVPQSRARQPAKLSRKSRAAHPALCGALPHNDGKRPSLPGDAVRTTRSACITVPRWRLRVVCFASAGGPGRVRAMDHARQDQRPRRAAVSVAAQPAPVRDARAAARVADRSASRRRAQGCALPSQEQRSWQPRTAVAHAAVSTIGPRPRREHEPSRALAGQPVASVVCA